jgi:glycosyltransferase involved in cell wall biosynthesis
MRILYINYVSSDLLDSGSSVRPTKILEAFRNTDNELIVLTGEQTMADRGRHVKDTRKYIDAHRPDICYIESPTRAIFRRCDRQLIKHLREMGVPTGFFLRDFHELFRKEFPRRRSSLFNYLKDVYWDYLLPKTLNTIRYCDIVYLPSDECKNLFDYKDMRALPPAGENHISKNKEFNHTCIYVGGWTHHYDSKFLLEAFDLLCREDPSYHLILVCRKNEWDAFESPYKKAPWLEVHHTSGKELAPLYERASVGLIIPQPDYEYSRYAVSVKTFEYMGYGLPIVAIHSSAMGKIIRDEKIGLTAEYRKEAYAAAIKEITDCEATYWSYADNVRDALTNRNLWKHRVEQIISDLTPLKK